MSQPVRYGRWTFQSDYLFGTDESGRTHRFSRAERILLTKLTENAGTVLSRERLLDALCGLGSDSSDRNVDFIVNRLRRKLGDAARKPTYIGTQYGEGYIWIAERVEPRRDASGAFLVVGPVRGLKHTNDLAEHARKFSQSLCDRLDRHTARDRRVVLDEICPSPDAFSGTKPDFSLELNFVVVDGRLDCALSLKVFAADQIVTVARRTIFDAQASTGQVDRSAVEAIARQVTSAIWDVLAYRASVSAAPSDEPLAVRMHEAALQLANLESWEEGQRRLRRTLDENPEDHRAQLMLATILHSKYLLAAKILPHQDFRAQDEDEMERLVLSSLPHLQDNPIFVMAAAKLLYFLDRGHRPLALRMAEEAFASTTAFATSFAVWGQMRMFQGDIAGAVRLFEQGLELTRNDSQFEIFLMVLKCQALLASGSREAVDTAAEALYRKGPEMRIGLSHLFTSTEPGKITPEALLMLQRLEKEHARAIVLWENYICARLFEQVEHRENILRGPLTLFVDRFGEDVVPDEVRACVPALFPPRSDRIPSSRRSPLYAGQGR